MKLERIKIPGRIFHRRKWRVFRVSGAAKPCRHCRHLVSVTTPDIDLSSDAVEKP